MKETKKYMKRFLKFLEQESCNGEKLINIKQQKKGEKIQFKIHPIYKNNSIHSINTQRSTIPGDTEIPLKAFEIVIQSLLEDDEHTLYKGNAQKRGIKIGDPELETSTLEAIVAKECYDKNLGESVYRRMPVISNILCAARICENIREGSRLKLIVD